jgi:hypothetical protein
MMRLAIAGTVLLAFVSGAIAAGPQDSRRAVNRGAAPAKSETSPDDALRGRVVEIQQTLDRILAETLPAPVGTTAASKATTTDTQGARSTAITVDRARLLHVRQQLDALLATLNGRDTRRER